MPPRPNSPAMRYRPANTVPGRKRPSSTLLVALRRGTLAAPLPSTTVSAEGASSGAAQEAQNRLLSPQSREKVAQGASHGNKRVRQGAPEGRKNPFTGIHPSPGTKGLLTPLRGWRVSGPV